MRVVVVGASSGIGRSIGLGLAAAGDRVALLARRRHRLEEAVAESGGNALAVACDVTDEEGCRRAVEEAAAALGGVDGLVYATAMGNMAPVEDVGADTWAEMFATNVTGASTVTAAALPHLTEAQGAAVYLSSISASMTPPWPLLGAYVTSKAALDKLVEVWRVEHPEVGFTRFTMGDCIGGEGPSTTELLRGVDPALIGQAVGEWSARKYFTGNFIDVEHLVEVIRSVLVVGKSSVVPTVQLVARIPVGSEMPTLDFGEYAENPEA